MKKFMILLTFLVIATFVSCNGTEDEDWYLDETSYFQAAGKIDISSLNTSNGAISAPITERIKLVEYEIDNVLFEFKQPVESGKCLEIMNDSLYFPSN